MTKVMFIFSPISCGLELRSVNHGSTYENSESNVSKTNLGEISNNCRMTIWNKCIHVLMD